MGKIKRSKAYHSDESSSASERSSSKDYRKRIKLKQNHHVLSAMHSDAGSTKSNEEFGMSGYSDKESSRSKHKFAEKKKKKHKKEKKSKKHKKHRKMSVEESDEKKSSNISSDHETIVDSMQKPAPKGRKAECNSPKSHQSWMIERTSHNKQDPLPNQAASRWDSSGEGEHSHHRKVGLENKYPKTYRTMGSDSCNDDGYRYRRRSPGSSEHYHSRDVERGRNYAEHQNFGASRSGDYQRRNDYDDKRGHSNYSKQIAHYTKHRARQFSSNEYANDKKLQNRVSRQSDENDEQPTTDRMSVGADSREQRGDHSREHSTSVNEPGSQHRRTGSDSYVTYQHISRDSRNRHSYSKPTRNSRDYAENSHIHERKGNYSQPDNKQKSNATAGKSNFSPNVEARRRSHRSRSRSLILQRSESPKLRNNSERLPISKKNATDRIEDQEHDWGKQTEHKTKLHHSDDMEHGSKFEKRIKTEACDDEAESASKKIEQPNFGLSGKLTEDANKVNGVVIAYAEPPGARKPKRRWRLYPFKGEQALPTLYIHRQSCYLVGRDRKVCDLPVDHPSCSKQHAVLQYRLVPYERLDGSTSQRVRPYIIDLESSNGTFVNNKQIEPKRYLELHEKDVLKFGFSSREYVLLHENSKEDNEDDEGYDVSPGNTANSGNK
ncbi:probable serine/threonine-protein kinase DDB_G0280133 [Anopheles nili]|uniref:probable serine/threonine-protein kinase DDB_G0280133 n=1 Tax=Anopheles nili TaxID=185578 RepID=UPI00237AC4D9|nr:probable serine/threonine-protein kinase DDB_G0280133 [Anopheles nili]